LSVQVVAPVAITTLLRFVAQATQPWRS
jgi:hypothetical protein